MTWTVILLVLAALLGVALAVLLWSPKVREDYHDEAQALGACLAACPADPGVSPVCSCSNTTYPSACAARCHEPWSARYDPGPCRALPFMPQPPCDRCGCPQTIDWL